MWQNMCYAYLIGHYQGQLVNLIILTTRTMFLSMEIFRIAQYTSENSNGHIALLQCFIPVGAFWKYLKKAPTGPKWYKKWYVALDVEVLHVGGKALQSKLRSWILLAACPERGDLWWKKMNAKCQASKSWLSKFEILSIFMVWTLITGQYSCFRLDIYLLQYLLSGLSYRGILPHTIFVPWCCLLVHAGGIATFAKAPNHM